MKRLRDIANISSGYPFRGSLNEDPDGNVRVLQLKDVSEALFIECSSGTKIELDGLKTKYLIKSGDLVFRSRGQTNTAAVVPAFSGTMVCAAPLFHIRITSSEVTPEYITWFIGQPASQSHFNSHAKGTSVRMIGRDALEDLPICIPPLDVQRKITALAELSNRELRLMEQLADRKKAWVSGLLMQVASKTGNGAEKERLPGVVTNPPCGER